MLRGQNPTVPHSRDTSSKQNGILSAAAQQSRGDAGSQAQILPHSRSDSLRRPYRSHTAAGSGGPRPLSSRLLRAADVRHGTHRPYHGRHGATTLTRITRMAQPGKRHARAGSLRYRCNCCCCRCHCRFHCRCRCCCLLAVYHSPLRHALSLDRSRVCASPQRDVPPAVRVGAAHVPAPPRRDALLPLSLGARGLASHQAAPQGGQSQRGQ
jgi:hypothetical protein